MGPYSHVVIANELETFIKPDNVQEFYWGAVAPDVRHVVRGMPKEQTHLSLEKILNYCNRYPDLNDFLKGYLIHCLSDQLSLRRIFRGKFPFSLIKKRITKKKCSFILEFLNIELLKPFHHSLSGENNVILNRLGINDEHVAIFINEINRYINSPSYSSSITLYKNLGLPGHCKLEKYQAAEQLWQNVSFLKNLILKGIHVSKINQEMAAIVKMRISQL